MSKTTMVARGTMIKLKNGSYRFPVETGSVRTGSVRMGLVRTDLRHRI